MPVMELDMLIAFVNRADRLHKVAAEVFSRIAAGELRGVAVPASAYVEYELVLRSRGYSEEVVRSDIEALRRVRNLGEVPLTSEVIVEASRLREAYGLTYFDSLHAASALLHDGVMISVDEAYRRVRGLRALRPEEVLAPRQPRGRR